MQTFLTEENFMAAAQALDNKRLNKQLLEGVQIYRIISTHPEKGGWLNHPAVRMWEGHNDALYAYLSCIKIECDVRGIKTDKNWHNLTLLRQNDTGRYHYEDPPWLGDQRLHKSHRQNLFLKDPDYYAEFAWDAIDPKVTCCDRCNYFWPTHTLMYSL